MINISRSFAVVFVNVEGLAIEKVFAGRDRALATIAVVLATGQIVVRFRSAFLVRRVEVLTN